MKRNILYLAFSLVLLIKPAFAEVRHSLGAGVQFAGIIGYQVSEQYGRNSFRVGFGVIGISTGYDYFITPNIAIGLQTFGSLFARGTGLNMNYYFSPTPSASWMIGVDVGRVYHSPLFGEDYTETASFISAGYRF